MKRLIFFSVLMFVCKVSVSQQVDSLSCSLAAVSDGDRYAHLSWNAVAGNPRYSICRRLPGQQEFDTIAFTADTEYVDHIPFVVCDTVFYFVVSRVGETLFVSNRSGDIVYDNSQPVTGCGYGIASVDSISQRILLRWQASPDEDIWGYYLCSGDPCMDYDTVWGRLNNEYECSDLQSTGKHIFRILAFDSCMQASPLTQPFHNIVLTANAPPCSNRVELSWNRYINMPDSVGLYRIMMRIDGEGASFHEVATVAPQGPYSYSIPVDRPGHRVCVKVVAENNTGTIFSESNTVCCDIPQPDTALYIMSQTAEYDEVEHLINLSFLVDAEFYAENGYTLYRGLNRSPMTEYANIPCDGLSTVCFTDMGLSDTDSIFSYCLAVEDGCMMNEKRSDTVEVVIGTPDPVYLFFPNVFTPDEDANNRFCPVCGLLPIVEYSMDIFSRTGLSVFHSDDIGQCWEGTDSSGLPVPQGAYVYRVYCKVGAKRVATYVGSVLLLR